MSAGAKRLEVLLDPCGPGDFTAILEVLQVRGFKVIESYREETETYKIVAEGKPHGQPYRTVGRPRKHPEIPDADVTGGPLSPDETKYVIGRQL